MSKVAVITDSIACLNQEDVERYRIRVVPLVLTINSQVYHDWVELTPPEGYRLLEEHPDSFSAAPPSPAEFLEAYRQAAAEAQSILCVTLASRLSTTCQSARTAQELAATELPGLAIEILDSRSAAMGQGFIALAAARAAQQGMALGQVMEIAQAVRDRIRVLMVLDTVRHVYRTGRTPRLVSWLGAMIQIKPVLSLSDGVVHPVAWTRSKAKGIERLLMMLREEARRGGQLHVAVCHADVPEEAEGLRARVAAEFDCAELLVTGFSPIMGYATGRGVVGLTFYAQP